MEHELFQSKLKPSVDGALISDMIRSSSSGLNSHRTAAMELIIERSIQERRERTFRQARSSLGPDPTPQPKGEAPDTPTSQAQFPTPTTASQPSSPSLPNDTAGIATSLGSASDNHEVSQDSWTVSKSTKRVKKTTRCEEPSADVKTNLSPSEDFVELTCQKCDVKQLRSGLWRGIYCGQCSTIQSMKCVGCGTVRVSDIDACTTCHKKFK